MCWLEWQNQIITQLSLTLNNKLITNIPLIANIYDFNPDFISFFSLSASQSFSCVESSYFTSGQTFIHVCYVKLGIKIEKKEQID